MKFTIFIYLLFIHHILHVSSFTFDLNQVDKHGSKLYLSPANKNTIIDFYFSPNTVLNSCSTSGCTILYPDRTVLRFLDVQGQQKSYFLQSATLQITPSGVSRSEQKGIFIFTFQNLNQKVMVGVPMSDSISSGSPKTYQFNLASPNIGSSFSFLSQTTDQIKNSTGISLSSFNYLNSMDYGIFYHVYDPSTTSTYLLSYFILSNMKISLSGLPTYQNNFPPSGINYQQTGDKLGYGSQYQGIFQTHLRESYVLWTAMIGIFFYWIYYLKTEHITIQCYDKKFENNKWTCWSFYSLHFLGHQEYFTKLSRQTMMLITFSWQGFCLAFIYSHVTYGQGPAMIIWAAIIAYVTSVVFPYALGYFFLTKIYRATLQKFDISKKLQGHFNKKDGAQLYENQLDDLQEHLYGLYYWYYVTAFICFVVFWVVAVHKMRQIPRDYYYLHRYWLASLFIAFVVQHLVIDPLLTLLLGNYRCYQIRGYYYDFRLGEHFKQLQV